MMTAAEQAETAKLYGERWLHDLTETVSIFTNMKLFEKMLVQEESPELDPERYGKLRYTDAERQAVLGRQQAKLLREQEWITKGLTGSRITLHPLSDQAIANFQNQLQGAYDQNVTYFEHPQSTMRPDLKTAGLLPAHSIITEKIAGRFAGYNAADGTLDITTRTGTETVPFCEAIVEQYGPADHQAYAHVVPLLKFSAAAKY